MSSSRKPRSSKVAGAPRPCIRNLARFRRLVREAGSSEWKRIPWDEAFERIARHMKDDRDRNFESKNADGVTVNRWLTTGVLAASASSNETGYITHKFVRSLGILAFDNQARV